MDRHATPLRSFWRFSLRELLLFMLAAGALIGWGVLLYERSQRFEASALFEYSPMWRDEVEAALEEVGQAASLALPFAVTQADGPSANRSESYLLPLSTSNNGPFLKALESHIRQRLLKADFEAKGGASSSSGSSSMILISYRSQSRVGAVHICGFKNDDDRGRIVISTHEERGSRGGFSSGAGAGS